MYKLSWLRLISLTLISPFVYTYGVVENHFSRQYRTPLIFSLDYWWTVIEAWKYKFTGKKYDHSLKINKWDFMMYGRLCGIDKDILRVVEEKCRYGTRLSKNKVYCDISDDDSILLKVIGKDEYKLTMSGDVWHFHKYRRILNLNSDYILTKEQVETCLVTYFKTRSGR